jgi:hypothetical protein
MSQCNVEIGNAEQFGASRSGTMEHDDRFPAPIRQHFHLAPFDSADASAQSLRDGLLGRKSGCELGDAGTVPIALLLGVDPVQETFTKIVEGALNSGNLDYVDPDDDATAPVRVEFRNVHPSRHLLRFRLANNPIPIQKGGARPDERSLYDCVPHHFHLPE